MLRRPLRSPWPWLGLGISLALTLLVWQVVRRAERDRLNDLQAAQATAMARQLQARTEDMTLLLRSASGYLGRGSLPTRAEWRAYVEHLGLTTFHPGIQGMGFAEWIPRSELNAHIERLRKEGFPDYRVLPGGPLPEDPDGCSSIIYLEPMDARNPPAFGKDMLRETVRREAMARARDQDLVSLSAPVTLFQETATEVQAGTLLFAPVYRQGAPLETVADRRKAFRGWAYFPLRMSDLVTAVLARNLKLSDLRVSDRAVADAPLFDSESVAASKGPVPATEESIEVAGRTWILRMRPNALFFEEAGRKHHWEILIGGCAGSLLLFAGLVAVMGSESRARQLAQRRADELLATESRFRALFEKAPMGMAIVDSNTGQFLSANPRLGEILGYSHEALLACTFRDVTHPDHLKADLESAHQLALGTVAEVQKEKRYLHKDGHVVWGRLTMAKLPTEPGQPPRHFAVVEDISLAHQAEEERRASEQRFKGMFELSPDPITLSRLSDATLVMANPAWCGLTGIPLEEALGRPLTDLGIWPQAEARESLIQEIRVSGRVMGREALLRHRGGSERHVLVTAQALRLGDEDLVLMLGKDVTAFMEMERSLQDSESRLRTLGNQLPDGFLFTFLEVPGGTSRFTYLSSGVERLCGVTVEAALEDPRRLFHLMDPDQVAAFREATTASSRELTPFIMDLRQKGPNGDRRWLRVSSMPRAQAGGAVIWDGVSIDITEQQQALAAIEESRFRLERQAKRYARLLATSRDAIHVIDPRGRLREWNPAFLEHLGYSETEAPGLRVFDWDHQWSEAELLEKIAAAIHAPQRFETVHRRKDGTLRHVELNATGIELDGEKLLYVSARDMTDATVARQALDASRRRYQGLFDLCPDGISVTRLRDGTLVEVNAAWEAMFGFTREEALGRTTGDLGVYARLEDRQALLDQISRSGAVSTVMLNLRRKDGTPLIAEVNGRVTEVGDERCLVVVLRDETLKETMKASLQESEARFRTVVEESPVALFIHRQGRFVYLNPAATAMLRASRPEDLVGQSVLDRIHPEDLEAVRERMRLGAEQGQVAPPMEERFFTLDGEVMTGEVQARPIIYEGQPATLVYAQDIGPRKAAEAAFRESESRFRTVAEESPVAIFVYREDRFIYVNPAGVALMKARVPEDLLGTSMIERVHPARRELVRSRVSEAVRTGQPKPVGEEQLLALDGTVLDVEVQGRPIVYGGLPAVMAFVQDISQRKRATEALVESEARFRSLADTAPVLIWLSDPNGLCTYFNQSWIAWTGLDPELAYGKGWAAFIHPEDLPRCAEAAAAQFEAKAPFTLEFRLRHHSGAYRWISDRGTPRFAADGSFLGYIGAGIDIQDLKDAEAAVWNSEFRARKAESLVLMAGGIAHDFNNLFQGVLGYLEIATSKAGDNAPLVRTLNKAVDTLRKAIGLSWKMLDFSGRGLMRLESLDLETWLPACLATLHLELPPNFQLDLACESVPFIDADPSKLEQVLKAVVDNAREAAGGEGGCAHVRLRADFGEDHPGPTSPGVWPLARPDCPATVCLEIFDEGPGLRADQLNLICDPFYTTKELGRGLGLAAAVGILRAHRAGLHILSGEGKGLILRMHFPPGGA
ncbi:hypothetical protein GETHLI_02770 [Geothrix limicola]|uniref:histidine kinase n=1 Tax=Geothrix limicola TaxID=2927978 RepID=A0ABQ5QBF0_9BACT|nr:PAS domain S-box protein [Geothrix limicola]GLH71775.1 hypothetical protein GETHLI_02770 [Geothrix limicola]